MAYNLSNRKKPEYFGKNTVSFNMDIKGLKMEEGEIMNAGDMVSLFTTVPIKEALIIIGKRLRAEKTLHHCMYLTKEDITSYWSLYCPPHISVAIEKYIGRSRERKWAALCQWWC